MRDHFYADPDNVPEVFRIADMIMDEKYPEPEIVKEPHPVKVPVPTIKENRGAEGPIIITEDWYTSEKIKQEKRHEKERKIAEVEMIQYLTKKEMLLKQLNNLDISKPKDAKKIAAINVELNQINMEIGQLEMMYGISATEIDQGTKVGRFLGKMKKGIRKIGKKVKKFYKRNLELVYGLATIFLPVLGGLFFKKILS